MYLYYNIQDKMNIILLSIIFVINISVTIQTPSKPVDLTWTFENTTISWPGNTEFHFTRQLASKINNEYWYAANDFCVGEHAGTHLDAPYHFYKEGWKVGNIPLERLITQGILVDISKEVEKAGPSRNLEESDLIQWEKENGLIHNNSVILIKFGWSKHYPNKNSYLGTNAEGKLNFPGISATAAQWLVSSGKIVGVGVDVASVDPGASDKYEAHRILAEANIYNLENVKLVEDLPVRNFTLLVMPMHIAEGTGAPLRLIALLNE